MNKTSQNAAPLFALSLLSLAACGAAEAQDGPGASPAEPPVAAHRAAALCTDDAADATASWGYHRYMGAGSPLPSDAYDRADCNDRFTVEVDGLLGKRFQIAGAWNAPLPSNDVACGVSFVQVRSFGFRPLRCRLGQGCSGGWQEIGEEITLKGQWDSRWSSCYLVPADPARPLPWIVSSPYSAVRVAVRAFAFPFFAIAPQPAWGGIYRDDVIY